MPRLSFTCPDGSVSSIEAAAGTTLMLAAIHNNVPGIEAECGGSLNCATCHVYVDAAFADVVEPPSEMETEMLVAVAAERRETSRLACQITLTERLDGLSVSIPDRQI